MIQQFHSWVYIQKNENTNLKRHMHPNVHNSTIYNSHDMEATQVPSNRQMNKEDVVYIYIYTMKYHSAIRKNEIGSFVETWMDLETVIQSEVSQKEIGRAHV